MKDAKGHGSNPRGTHASAVERVGLIPIGVHPVLRDGRAIAEYIEDNSPREVDKDYIEENYQGASATLQTFPISQLQEGDPDHNIPSPSKERKYAKMDRSTMPPIVVEDGKVVDGNHRLRVAKAAGAKTILGYDVTYDE